MKKNNSWYKFNPATNVTIVFVHGFLSNSKSCWTSKSGIFWPDLISEDARFDDPSIFLGGYHTAHDSGDYKLRDCVEELLRALERESPDGCSAPLMSSNILFVCHSLGGIVVRYMLEAHTSKFVGKTIGLALMASPSLGSEYADTLSGIINFYRNGVGRQLRHMNETLTDLDSRFRLLVEDQRIPNLVGAEAIEHHFLFRLRLLPGFRPIVTRESASRYFASSQVLAETDHSTIVKPNGINAPGHQFLYDFFSAKFKPLIQYIPNPIESIDNIHYAPFAGNCDKTPPSNKVLFDIYSADCADYYLGRAIDDEISRSLSLYSVWVSGQSGCGKTSAVRHFLYAHGHKPIEVCLASCQGKLDSSRVIDEIAATLYQRYGKGEGGYQPTLSGLANLLAEHASKSTILLYLDEVPIEEGDIDSITELATLVGSLLESTKHLTGNSDVRFVISSIAAPTLPKGNPGKFAEHILPIGMAPWSRAELADLLEKILINLNLGDLSVDEKDELIDVANGSPRFIKRYLKNRLVSPSLGSEEVLQMTIKQTVQ